MDNGQESIRQAICNQIARLAPDAKPEKIIKRVQTVCGVSVAQVVDAMEQLRSERKIGRLPDRTYHLGTVHMSMADLHLVAPAPEQHSLF